MPDGAGFIFPPFDRPEPLATPATNGYMHGRLARTECAAWARFRRIGPDLGFGPLEAVDEGVRSSPLDRGSEGRDEAGMRPGSGAIANVN